MKKSILIIVMTLFLASCIDGIAALPAKFTRLPNGDMLWSYGSSVLKTWKPKGNNEYGDPHFACVDAGSDCGENDWYTEVQGVVFSNPSNTEQCMNEFQTYVEVNRPEMLNPNYGWNKSREAEATVGIILPATPPNPGVIQKFVFPFGS